MAQSGFQNVTFTTRKSILSQQGNRKVDPGAALSAIGEALVRKDLREPSNFNILFDLLCVLGIVNLCVWATPKEFPVWTCVIVMVGFIGLCFAWVVYVYSRKK